MNYGTVVLITSYSVSEVVILPETDTYICSRGSSCSCGRCCCLSGFSCNFFRCNAGPVSVKILHNCCSAIRETRVSVVTDSGN